MRRLYRALLAASQLPLLAAATRGPVRVAVARDVRRHLQPRLDLPLPESVSRGDMARALRHRPLRSVLYARLAASTPLDRAIGLLLSRVHRGEPALYFSCGDIGPGLLLMHGFATVVTAERIGTDCQISQQVTIGWSDRGGPPVIGDRVRIGANAVVIGPVTLGDDCVVGAGAVVVHDVPPGKVVGGVPARVIEGAADRFGARRPA